jgi:hypothetical protein
MTYSETARFAMEEIEAALDVADIAAELVALWDSPNIRGLPRADRNTAIEGARDKLIKAVHEWQVAKGLGLDLREKV